MQKIRLSIHLFDVPKFIRLRDNNEYLEKFVEEINSEWTVKEESIEEIK